MFRVLMALLLAGTALAGVARGEDGPVVVELFTSQGCSSCPPADELLAELADRPDVIALSHHVDYWNYIGWADPFSSPEATARQQAYRDALGLRVVYTPQMVIDGRRDVAGSRRAAVETAVEEASARADRIAVTIAGDAQTGYRAELPEAALPAPATVWLVLFDPLHETAVSRGENAGAVLRNRNVVRELRSLGSWTGEATALPVETAGRDGCAIIVQRGKAGPILGAAAMMVDD